VLNQKGLTVSNIPFGFFNKEHELAIVEFKPDSEGLPWFESTGQLVSITGLEIVSVETSSVSGRCIDTGEWLSPAATILESMIEKAPQNTVIAAGKRSWWAGTRTWGEDYWVVFYA